MKAKESHEVDVRAVVETWAAELADPIPYDIDATGPIPKPVAVPGVDIETLINRLTVHMGQPATERVRAAAEEIVGFLFDSYPDNDMKRGDAIGHVASLIIKHSASRDDGGEMRAALEKIRDMDAHSKWCRSISPPQTCDCHIAIAITALEELARGGDESK